MVVIKRVDCSMVPSGTLNCTSNVSCGTLIEEL